MRAHWGISIKCEVLHQLVLDFSSFLKKKIRQAKTPVPAKEQSLKLRQMHNSYAHCKEWVLLNSNEYLGCLCKVL